MARAFYLLYQHIQLGAFPAKIVNTRFIMKKPLQILEEVQNEIEPFIGWQEKAQSDNTFSDYAQEVSKAAEVFQYAALLYPKFIKVEGFVVVAEHYTEDNWRAWRQKLDARDTAQIMNHLHLEDFLYRDIWNVRKLEEHLGEMIACFWKMAVDQQFPDDNVCVEYNGDVINI